MPYQTFDQLLACVKDADKMTVAVAAAHDAHALEAVLAAAAEGFADYRLVGDRARILDIGAELGYSIDPATIVDAGDDEDCAFRAVEQIRQGTAGFLMKGKLETATLMRAVLHKETGIRTGGTMSHVAILEVPGYHKLLGITDGGMLPHPTLEQK